MRNIINEYHVHRIILLLCIKIFAIANCSSRPFHSIEMNNMTKIIVINALQKKPHISHFTLDEALALIADLKPEKAYLTHISHKLGKHRDVKKELPENVELAWDGLTAEI